MRFMSTKASDLTVTSTIALDSVSGVVDQCDDLDEVLT